MDRLDRLRPNLAELLKQDPKGARQEPLEQPAAPPELTRAAVNEAFAEKISRQHAVEARAGTTRPSAAAGMAEPVMLAHQRKRRNETP